MLFISNILLQVRNLSHLKMFPFYFYSQSKNKLLINTYLRPKPVLSLKSSGVVNPCFCRYVMVRSDPCISETAPVCSNLGLSSLSAREKPRPPSASSSPRAHSSEYSFRCLRSRCWRK